MAFKKILRAAVLFIIVFASYTAYSQTNLSDVRVDELSDDQIRQLIQRAKAVGYTTDQQIEQMATAQGLKPEEVQKLDQRLQKIRKSDQSGSNDNTTGSGSGLNGLRDNQNSNLDGRRYTNPDSLQSDTSGNFRNRNNQRQNRDVFGNLVPKIFGSELFKNSRMTFEPNLRLATPMNYVIGPDDQLLVDITGDNEASYQLKVSPEGTIKVQYAGLISVGGLTIEQATSKIRATLSKTYPGLRSGRTQVAVNLGNIRSIRVSLVGEVVKPGTYTLSSVSTVFNALSASGGPNDNGSFRNIQVVRNNKIIATIDVYDFLLKGIQRNNVRLQDQDVINIPVYKTRVELSGEVKRPALYEVQSNENLQEVLNFGGGFTNKAYTAAVKILQNTAKERRIIDVSSSDYNTYHPANGDKVVIEAILDRFENRVTIEGAVFRPGKYELDKGLTLKALIQKAEGLKEDAFLNRGYISRLNLDNTLSLITFDVQSIMNGTSADIPLQREDKVTISSIFDLRDEYKVQVQGEVRFPGTFKYADNMTLESVIQMAGGFKEGATPNRIEVSRRVKNSDAKSATSTVAQIFTVNVDQNLKLVGEPFILQPYDIVSVRSAEGYEVQKTVSIQGEVLYPGIYTIQRKNERISDLVKRAGGLTALAFPEGASLKRPGPPKDKLKKSRTDSLKAEEEKLRLINLRRLQMAQGVKDTLSLKEDSASVRSDMVGIELKKILQNPSSRYDLLLEDGDIINVPKELQTIRVSGEVLKPTNIIYKPGKTMEQYINESGGFTYNANKRGAYIEYANGAIKSTRKFLFFYDYPDVKPGGEIFVPKHAPREKLGITGIVGLSTALASLAAVLVTVLRK